MLCNVLLLTEQLAGEVHPGQSHEITRAFSFHCFLNQGQKINDDDICPWEYRAPMETLQAGGTSETSFTL